MKKIIATLIFMCALTAGAFGQTDVRLLNLNEYASCFGFVNGNIRPADNNIVAAPREDRAFFGILDKREIVDTPLEFALLSYYSQPVLNIRPAQADAILPRNNPRLSDQKLGAAVFQEIQILRFLGDTAAVNRHEAVLQFITGRGNATRAEIEAFYRNNIRGLIEGVVDREFSGITIPASTVTYVKNSLTNFFTTPNQTNFNTLKSIFHSTDGDLEFIQRGYVADMLLLEDARERGLTVLIDSHESLVRYSQNILNERRRQLNAPLEPTDARIDWRGFSSAYIIILNGFNPELVRRM